MSTYRRLEDLVVYQKLCRLHIEVCALTHCWPSEEKYELGSQARRSSNSAPAQLAEKYDDRHIRNKVEGVDRSRGEAADTVHHLYMAYLKGYEMMATYETFRDRYQECIRMLNGMERALEKNLPERDRRWPEKEGKQGPGKEPGPKVQEERGQFENSYLDGELTQSTCEQSGYPGPQFLNPDP